MVEIVLQYLQGLPGELVVFLLSMMPVIELRGAIPVAFEVYNYPILKSLLLIIIGNMVPGFLIVYGWDWFIDTLDGYWPWLRKQMAKIEARTKGKSEGKILKYGPIALILFVAIPLPGSGVWTGSLAAWLMGLPKKKSMLAIFAGVLIAAVAVSILTYSISSLV